MARSSYIYIVFQKGSDLPVAPFTVKHEMVTWIKRNRYNAYANGDITVYRYPDAGYCHFEEPARVPMDISKLMEEE